MTLQASHCLGSCLFELCWKVLANGPASCLIIELAPQSVSGSHRNGLTGYDSKWTQVINRIMLVHTEMDFTQKWTSYINGLHT